MLMKGLLGWFAERVPSNRGSVLSGMMRAAGLRESDCTVYETDRAGLAAVGRVASPVLVERDGYILAICGHPRLCRGERRSADPIVLLQALREGGAATLSDVVGDFALAGWDTRAGAGLIAIDRFAMHQLVYTHVDGELVFGSNLDMLGGHPSVQRELSPQGLFDYIYFHVSPGPGTLFKKQFRLAPGHYVEFGQGASGEPRPYWSLRFVEGGDQGFGMLKARFVALLQAAVEEAAEGPDSVGAFLSGGTDSSSVCGMLARSGSKPVRAFSIGFDVPGYDEMEYARIAANHFGCEHHEYYVTPHDVVDAVPLIAAKYDQPFGNASAVPVYFCARFAQELGVTRLLAGDGGDELFGGNERYAKHRLLGLYGRIPSVLRRRLVEPLVEALPSSTPVWPLRKLRSYVEQARPPMPRRYASYNLLDHLGAGNVFTREFLAEVDDGHPMELMEQTHASHRGDSLINQMLAQDIRFILADGDLPKVTRMCELALVDVAFPMLDDRLAAFSQSLPSRFKLRGTTLRWFFKRALNDFLPPAVISKRKHGFGLPVGAWLTGHKPLRDLAADAIEPLRSRGFVEGRFLDDLMAHKVAEHPAYFGTMVWILMMLGLWLDSRKI